MARTVIDRLAPSASRSIAPATVTMPGHGVDRESAAVVVIQRVGDRVAGISVIGKRRDADGCSNDAFSSTASTVTSVSEIAVVELSLTGVTVMLNVPPELDDPLHRRR